MATRNYGRLKLRQIVKALVVYHGGLQLEIQAGRGGLRHRMAALALSFAIAILNQCTDD